MSIVPPLCVALAAALAGLLFAPVFGVPALLLPVLVPALVLFAVAVFASRRESLVPWRPLLLVLVGLLAVAETTVFATTAAGLPTGETLGALARGVTESWQLALQSTWPARPVPALLLFVPLLVVLAGVLGLELWYRSEKPLAALAPSLVVVVLSQLYAALSGWTATLAALAYAAVGGTLLALTRHDAGPREPGLAMRARAAAAPVGIAVVCAVVAGVLLPSPPARYSLKEDRLAPLEDLHVANPLDEIAYRLAHPDTPVFEVRGDSPDRWPVVVLSEFDGANWTPGARYRALGTELEPGPEVTVDVDKRSAEIAPTGLDGPWLPSQPWPAAVRGADPLVEENQGSLILPEQGAAESYSLTWWAPEITGEVLSGAGIDPGAPGGLAGIGTVPEGVGELADEAVRGMRPTFRTALMLENFFHENYSLATGEDIPTGHTWSQLRTFLLESKRGTSEQFAASYVALARILGIPARLVVGYRAPSPGDDGARTVRNGDVLAWPQVAVKGVGWVSLDPARTEGEGGSDSDDGLAAATAEAREQLPPPEDLRDPPVAPSEEGEQPASADDGGGPFPWWLLLGVPFGLGLVWVAGVPLVTALRAWGRRRRDGAGAVVGAWEEARDRLRAHGVVVSAGMTVRDLAAEAGRIADAETVHGVRRLGSTVDLALWSGAPVGQETGPSAWAAVRDVRRGLARRGLRARVRAALNPRALRAPR
ncbi:transglutaminase-like domain-containing protein [Prauserella cavernicola]|uniref:Transglutaminase domain-containing protein n=1 Tax=Prauserella cavernicola TaxID=2800127 RepID=A0A934V987_9PSEU|nr:transglutaminase-like domain-containing protein [Prauserella cavernicola]MBK1789085.1 transglutaminase domain-containing protein [Prauserella cavernicola]